MVLEPGSKTPFARYIVHLNPTIPVASLVATGILNLLGYMIYRTSETERCELSRDPNNPALSHLQTLDGLQVRMNVLVVSFRYNSPGPVNWGVVYPTVTTQAALGSKSVFLRCPNRT